MKPRYVSMLLAGLLLALPSVVNGGELKTDWPLIIHLKDAGVEPPDVTVLPDGTVLLKLKTVDRAKGDLKGTFSEHVTQVYNQADEYGFMPITSYWILKTAHGTIEGYCSGQFNHLAGYNHDIQMHGEVLSVTEAYVDLYRAEVFYKATLGDDHVTFIGTLTIAPRTPLISPRIPRTDP
jgi:hypothetical protein